jgi:mannose-6-phosphate isomerase-like protein (cupin superfamily)
MPFGTTSGGTEMEPYQSELKEVAKDNDDFRRVLFTGAHSQLVVMALAGGEEIGEEVHRVDQILYAVDGEGEAFVDGRRKTFEKGDVVAVPAGSRHNIRNTENKPLRLFTVYAPPQHPAGTVHHTKADAVAAEAKEPMALLGGQAE